MRRKKPEEIVVPQALVGKIDTYEAVQWITGPIELGPDATMDDLPPKIQDIVYAALEKLADKEQKPITVVRVMCGREPEPPDPKHEWYLHVIASEIVAADSRKIRIIGQQWGKVH